MPRLSINGLSLYYEIHGQGMPLLLVAGLASDSQSWPTVLDALACRCRVITPDNRGAGRTTSADANAGIQDMADDCAALIRHLGLGPVHVLGHSMGGMVAQDLAVRHPGLVDRLLLAATASKNPRPNNLLFADWADSLDAGIDPELWFRQIFTWIFSARFFEDEKTVGEAVRLAIEYPYPQTPAAFRNQVRAIAAFDSTANLSRIRAGTLVLAGTEDLLFPVPRCEGLARGIPDARFARIEGVAHSLHMENPGAFTEIVLDFLSET